MSPVSVVLFTRDLRVHDHPALAAARREAGSQGSVVPVFVLDPGVLALAGPNRRAFLAESLADLDGALAERGGRLVVREGETVAEVMAVVAEVGARSVHASTDVSRTARARESRLDAACRNAGVRLELHPGVTVVPPGELTPSGGDHYKVFTPYFRAWSEAWWRDPAPAPRRIAVPEGVAGRAAPTPAELAPSGTSPGRDRGGLREGRARLRRWLRSGLDGYGERADRLDVAATSRLSPFLHFGCLSPREVAQAARDAGADGFARQLCWRDFLHQVAAAFPDLSRADYRPRGRRWLGEGPAFDMWQEGRTGVPLVDAAMGQLHGEGWVHNRARMVAASYLTKTLGVHWRLGADHYMRWLTDGDVAVNYGSWQWAAGTGNDTRPNRVLNPERQAKRFDPDGAYVARWTGGG